MHDGTFRALTLGFLASTALATPAFGQTTPATPPEQPTTPAQQAAQAEQEIIITATKRAENLQDVPMAITAIPTKTLEDLQVNSFEDYARLVPSLSYKSGGGGGSADGPGTNNVYFRGVASGENANHSASLPSVGTYLDEQPITTITGALDVHVFDMARIEALAGPQGTLYGASSQAGTIRLITNKPDLSGSYGQVNLELNKIAHGDFGYSGEGFVNLPINSNVAARIVGWYRRDGGYIDNIEGSLPFPVFTTVPAPTPEDPDAFNIVPTGEVLTFSNADLAEDDYNDVYTYGARAALRIELDDSWTVTPQLMGQHQKSYGSFAQESGLDELETMQFNPEKLVDKWYQAALTVEGKIGNFDVTYAGSYMQRQVDSELDYVDYGYFYNSLFNYVGYLWYDNAGEPIVGNQFVIADDSFTKQSHELRFASPVDKPIRLIAGAFYQRQTHNIEQDYIIPNITDAFVITGTESNIWLTKQLRVDRDYALFGEISFDITPEVTLTGGGRLYKFNNSLVGFFGFNANYSGSTGESQCFGPPVVDGSPCTNLDKRTKGDGFVHRLNATWKPNEDLLLYATWSRGFRPGGVNRRGTLPPYKPDFLTNYEAGAKYSFGRGAHLNAAVYREEWNDMQLSFLGANGLTEIRNAGNARIWGVEADVLLRPMSGLNWSTGVAYTNGKMRNDFCLIAVENFDCTVDVDLDGDGIPEKNKRLAEAGTRLPLTARWKANSHIRYEWAITGDMRAHAQGNVTYEGKRRRDLRDFENALYGNLKSYALFDAAAGLERGPWHAELYVKNLFDKRAQLSRSIQCLETTCGDPDGVTAIGGKTYTVVARPRTIGLRVGRRF
jgi:iron complex outermembrane receptor protein